MSLLLSWADSIAFLWSANAKLAFYGLYKGIRETYWILITKFWWLILFSLVLGRIIPMQYGFRYFFTVVWAIVTILVVRPSMQNKNYSYFARFAYFAVVATILALLFMMLKLFLRLPLFRFVSLAVGMYSPLYMSIAFFMSESMSSFSAALRNIKQGLKMVFYNYPLFFIIHGILFICWSFIFVPIIIYLSKLLLSSFGPLQFYYIRIFLLPIYVCIVNTLFIVRRAAQPELYEES